MREGRPANTDNLGEKRMGLGKPKLMGGRGYMDR